MSPGPFALYRRFMVAALRAQLEYRTAFVAQLVSMTLHGFLEYGALVAMFMRFHSLAGWTLPEVALLYGMVQVSFALVDITAGGFDHFGDLVRQGDLDRMLVRPRAIPLQVAGIEINLHRLGRFFLGAGVLVWSLDVLGVHWSAAKGALLGTALVGGMFLFYGLLVLQAAMAVFTTESLEVMNIFTYGGVETASYPLEIYPPWFRRFFTGLVPLAGANYLPALALLDRTSAAGYPAWAPWVAPLMGALFFGFALLVFRRALDHYQSAGG